MKKVDVIIPIGLIAKYKSSFYHDPNVVDLVKEVYKYAYHKGGMAEYDRLMS